MLVANALIRRRERDSSPALDVITLDSDGRARRRFRVTSDGGRDVLIDLAEASFLQEGDALETEAGLFEIRAAPEPLLEIRATDPLSLARLAWHLGNRHTAAELTEGALYIQPDHVLQELMTRLGAAVQPVSRPFNPEGGAYHHSHDHGH
jgi:urease accessory protein